LDGAGRQAAALYGRDIVSLVSVQHPREAFTSNGDPRRSEEPTDAVAG
jgi:NADH dehydrogenase